MTEENIDQCPECASWNVVVNEMKKQIVCRDCGGIFTIGHAGANAAVDVKVTSSSPVTRQKAAESKPAKKASSKKKPAKAAKKAKASKKAKPAKSAQSKKSKKGKKK